MRTGQYRWFSVFSACCLAFCGVSQFARAQSQIDCEQAGRAAEQRFGLPPGLLLAVGRVESGRWDPLLGRIVPWPWTVDIDGVGQLFDNSNQAISATRAARMAGRQNIDVGCFQISLLHHPDAFTDLDQAFDPQANAQYAAAFLVSLQARLGNWQDAVAAYHSAAPEFGVPYRQRVFAAWSGAAAFQQTASLQFPAFPGIHVWGPSPTGTAAEVIALHTVAPQPQALPRVITPGR